MLSDAVLLSGAVLLGNIVVSLMMDKRDKTVSDDKFKVLFKWKDEHVKESAEIRLGYSERLSSLDSKYEVTKSQYAEILRRLDGLDKKIDRIETREEG